MFMFTILTALTCREIGVLRGGVERTWEEGLCSAFVPLESHCPEPLRPRVDGAGATIGFLGAWMDGGGWVGWAGSGWAGWAWWGLAYSQTQTLLTLGFVVRCARATPSCSFVSRLLPTLGSMEDTVFTIYGLNTWNRFDNLDY